MSRAAEISEFLRTNRRSWLPQVFANGRATNYYFELGDAEGNAGDSLKVPWSHNKAGLRDFGNCFAGDDLDLLARGIGGDIAEAIRYAENSLGAPRAEKPIRRTATKPKAPPPRPAEPPKPNGAAVPDPPARHPELGEPTFRHEYTDAAGRLILYHCRFDSPGRKKEFRPLSFRDGRWQWRDPDGLLPLYGLAELAARPNDPVLIVEGEKAADVARDLLPNDVVIAWPHGAKAVDRVDWSPLAGRQAVIWPDNDEAGGEAVPKLAAALRAAGAASVRAVAPPAELPDAWDLADELPDGWDLDRVEHLIEVAAAVRDRLDELCLTPAAWATRDIPPPDRLLGDVFTTTTRTQLSAGTGLGKTMFGLACAFAMRLGEDFLGWKSHRPARVLIIDGEMPAELIKDRLAAAASWFGVGEPIADGLYLLSREDVEDMPPLDTPDGARWVLAFMDRLGRLDQVILDNVASLTASCMKEEEGERALVDLRREITKRNTGQFWLHHTGHDTSRGYGTKVREWHLDTVIVAEKLEHPSADVAFTLTFPKSRRRKPDNRGDFESREVVLAEGRWEHGASDGAERRGRSGKLPDGAVMARNALRKAIDEMGAPPPASSATVGVRAAVSLDQWRDMFGRMAPYGPEQDEARKKAFQRGSERLIAEGVARKWGGFVWLAKWDT